MHIKKFLLKKLILYFLKFKFKLKIQYLILKFEFKFQFFLFQIFSLKIIQKGKTKYKSKFVVFINFFNQIMLKTSKSKSVLLSTNINNHVHMDKKKDSKNKKSYQKVLEGRVRCQKNGKSKMNKKEQQKVKHQKQQNFLNQQDLVGNNFKFVQMGLQFGQKRDKNEKSLKQKRKSINSINQRPQSRISDKRFSNLSTKTSKIFNKNQMINKKQNNKNLGNTENCLENTKNDKINKQIKNQKQRTQKPNNLNNNKSKKDLGTISRKLSKQKPSKPMNGNHESKKNLTTKNIKMENFNKKLSQYLNQKDLFSTQFRNKISSKDEKSRKLAKSHSSSKDKQLSKSRKSSSTNKNRNNDNLFQVYNFYKKTFDINQNHCIRKGSLSHINNKTKNSIKSKISAQTSRNVMRPSSSSGVILSSSCSYNNANRNGGVKNVSSDMFMDHREQRQRSHKKYESLQLLYDKKSRQQQQFIQEEHSFEVQNKLTQKYPSADIQRINAQSIVISVNPNQMDINNIMDNIRVNQEKQRQKKLHKQSHQPTENLHISNLQNINISTIEGNQEQKQKYRQFQIKQQLIEQQVSEKSTGTKYQYSIKPSSTHLQNLPKRRLSRDLIVFTSSQTINHDKNKLLSKAQFQQKHQKTNNQINNHNKQLNQLLSQSMQINQMMKINKQNQLKNTQNKQNKQNTFTGGLKNNQGVNFNQIQQKEQTKKPIEGIKLIDQPVIIQNCLDLNKGMIVDDNYKNQDDENLDKQYKKKNNKNQGDLSIQMLSSISGIGQEGKQIIDTDDIEQKLFQPTSKPTQTQSNKKMVSRFQQSQQNFRF